MRCPEIHQPLQLVVPVCNCTMPSSFVDRDDLSSSGIYRAHFIHMNVRMNTCRPVQGQESCHSACHDETWSECRQLPSFVTLALDDVSGTSRTDCLYLWGQNPLHQLSKRLGGPPEAVWTPVKRQQSLRLWLQWSQNRHNTTVWTDSR